MCFIKNYSKGKCIHPIQSRKENLFYHRSFGYLHVERQMNRRIDHNRIFSDDRIPEVVADVVLQGLGNNRKRRSEERRVGKECRNRCAAYDATDETKKAIV